MTMLVVFLCKHSTNANNVGNFSHLLVTLPALTRIHLANIPDRISIQGLDSSICHLQGKDCQSLPYATVILPVTSSEFSTIQSQPQPFIISLCISIIVRMIWGCSFPRCILFVTPTQGGLPTKSYSGHLQEFSNGLTARLDNNLGISIYYYYYYFQNNSPCFQNQLECLVAECLKSQRHAFNIT